MLLIWTQVHYITQKFELQGLKMLPRGLAVRIHLFKVTCNGHACIFILSGQAFHQNMLLSFKSVNVKVKQNDPKKLLRIDEAACF